MDTAVETEAWGRCASCDRWFYCGRSIEAEDHPTCPVCHSAPAAVEHRPTSPERA